MWTWCAINLTPSKFFMRVNMVTMLEKTMMKLARYSWLATL